MPKTRLGIDVGALFFKAVRIDDQGCITHKFYERHHGHPTKILFRAIDELEIDDHTSIGITGTHADLISQEFGIPTQDLTYCRIQGIHHALPAVRALIDIGGVSSTLVQMDENAEFQDYSTNSLCAAGTGSFLDEQATRLGISYLDTINFSLVQDPPLIATRCSVFAKSDLIHRQQEGYGPEEMWSGLCRGMVKTLLGTLLYGRPLDRPTAILGGVAQNGEVIRWLKEIYPELIVVPKDPHLIIALGAAFHATQPKRMISSFQDVPRATVQNEMDRYPWSLSLEKSSYPSFETLISYVDSDQTEVRIHSDLKGQHSQVYLGIDVGSTSTKAVLINEKKEVLVDIYRKTLGDPIRATKFLFKALRELKEKYHVRFDFFGVGTTGSGRKIIGQLIGADAIVNEISAHVAGAIHVDPTIDTIFEIGGQDSKYMYLVDGHIRESNMNYVCAAGTGSFVEEQANKLGYKIQDAGPKVLGIHPPRATDRCTVFMEQDIAKLLQADAKPEEVFAAVMVSVTKNYLNKVVGNRHFNRKKIFFQGATARNPALVAAFEKILGVEVVVSSLCHVMGSYGVALVTQEMMHQTQKTNFRGLDLEKRDIQMRKEECHLCNNDCSITFADIEGEEKSPSWGYMCGREPEDTRVHVSKQDRYVRKRERFWLEAGHGIDVPASAPVIGIPQALSVYTYLPLWMRFFNRLGYHIQLSGTTSPEIRELGTRLAGADFCFPAKVFIGHAAYLSQKQGVDYIFAPQMTHSGEDQNVSASVFCPYVQGSPAYTRSSFLLNSMDDSRILNPVVDMRLSEKDVARLLAKVFKKSLNVSFKQIKDAWQDGLRAQKAFDQKCLIEGENALAEAREKGEKLIVLIGRPYNIYDKGINLGIPKKIGDRGRTVLPIDFIKPNLSLLEAKYRNMYWSYGQKILAVLHEVRESKSLDAIYFTNFSCGPDSFLLSYAEEIMGNRPFLALELDEHGSDTGYLTRIEAYFDVLEKPQPKLRERIPYFAPDDDFRERILWVPNMHPYGTDLMAAALNNQGYDARVLPMCEPETYELGRTLTRGSECLPTSLTIGRLIKTLKTTDAKGKKQAFFMPTAQGPCRFGQYATLHKQILNREGFQDVSILSPTSFNGYQGLDENIRRTIWKGMLAGDVLQKAVCKIRPYEMKKGETNAEVAKLIPRLAKAIQDGSDITNAVRDAIQTLCKIRICKTKQKPLVGIVGEIYVRNNTYANEDLITSIEELGGEVWMTPLSEWLLFTNCPQNIAQHNAYKFTKQTVQSFIKWKWLAHWEKNIYKAASPLLDDRHEPHVNHILKEGHQWLRSNIGGEAILSIGRAIQFARKGANLVVNVAPFCCMPGIVTTSIFRQVSADLNVPIVNLFYDGTGGQNQRLAVYLKNSLKEVA